MKPWPTWMDDTGLMAKSARPDKEPESLSRHTWNVLSRLSDQATRLRPELSAAIEHERLWQRMYWGCLLHDFGKAAVGFQDILKGIKNTWAEYGQRHEVLSLGFVDWLFPNGHPDRYWVIAVIACHHRDANTIFDAYGGRHSMREEAASIRDVALTLLPHLAAQINEETRWHLWRWLGECGTAWAEALGIKLLDTPQLIPFEQAVVTNLEKSIFRALRDFSQWAEALSENEQRTATLYRGLILTADHAASAGTDPFPPMQLTKTIARRPLDGRILRHHQQAAENADSGSAIMIAPTGSGKTEAALLWAARQMEQRPVSRLFYTLPYQASMNAMQKRLAERFFQGDTPVTIQHSRATLKFYQDMMESDSGTNPKVAVKQANALKNLAELNFYPVQVFSPYQMLKAAYSLKGFEALLVDYTNALFIFDEIHAYDPKRLALIITFMGWLAQHYQARFLVMTATLPPTARAVLEAALPGHSLIEADTQVFADSRRHEVHLLDGDLLSLLGQIEKEARQKKVLVCCNQVGRAIEVCQRLQSEYGFPADDLMLLHGRFNGKDRTAKEQRLAEVVGVGTPGRPYLVVATQVVEVSLDIDLDTIYTEPAPLEALLQRFGRVNRGRKAMRLCPVHVFREPVGAQESKPYDADMVQTSLDVLEHTCGGGRAIDEALVTHMLADIYQGDIAARWWVEYNRVADEFQRYILGTMRPFQSASREIWAQFYQMFDGIQVLPYACEEAYYHALDEGGFLAASEYLVNISHGQYHQLRGKGLVKSRNTEENEYVDHVAVPYNEWGLDIVGTLAKKDEDE